MNAQGNAYTRDGGEKGQERATLTGQAQQWPTPTLQDSEAAGGVGTITANNRRPTLNFTAQGWPTPASRDYRTPNAQSYQERSDSTKGEQLVNFVAHHFSPPGQETPDGPTSSPAAPGSPPPSASDSSTKRLPRLLAQRLNAYFVEWLMGWPLGWTSPIVRLASSARETALWRSALRQHLRSFFNDGTGV